MVLFRGPGTVTLTALNAAGATSMVIPSPVDPVPTIDALFAAPSRAGMGENVEIHWQTRDAKEVILEREGVGLGVNPSLVNGHHPDPTPIVTSTRYVLRAFNTLGHEVISEPIVVDTGAPNQLRFDTSDGMRLYRVNTDVELVWENDGGTSLTITNTQTGEVLPCSPTELAEIRSGTCTITMPPEQADLPLLLEVANGSGRDSRSLLLRAVTGPIIVDFTPEVEEITENDTVLFSWEVLPDAAGNIPMLTLRDDQDPPNHYDMTDVVGDAVLSGSKRFRIHGWGKEPRVFTLTAASPVPPVYSQTTEVMVYGIPTVDEMAATPPFVDAEGDFARFEWKTTHGVFLELFHLTESGEVDGTPFFSTENIDEIREGQVDVFPSIAAPHVRLVVTNKLGVPTTADFRIGVEPATITSFTVNGFEAPATLDVFMGDEITVAWETVRATSAYLEEGFVDISQNVNAQELTFTSTTTSAIETLDFPDGFSFPAQGKEFTAARVVRSGYLSFNLATTGNASNVMLPSTVENTQRFDMLPFWDALTNGKVFWQLFEADLDHLVIQWTGMNFSTAAGNPSDLNFQVVLYEDGSFEYRYGLMKGSAEHNKGLSATIAAQDLLGFEAKVLLFNNTEGAVDGLDGKVFRFENARENLESASSPLITPLQGSRTFKARIGGTFRLVASNGHSSETREIEVRVLPRKGRLTTWAEPAEPVPGQPVKLSWEGQNLSSLAIEDEEGNLVHEASVAELEAGSVDLGILLAGMHTYTFKATGAVSSDEIVEELLVSVNDGFELYEFEASNTYIRAVDVPVTLSWITTGATSATITELPGGTVTTIPVSDLDAGTHDVFPTRTTTYRLDVESHGRHRSAEVEIQVRSVWVEEFGAASRMVPTGGTTTLSWITDGDALVTLDPNDQPIEPMFEVTATSPYVSIADVGKRLVRLTTASTGRFDVTFPEDFAFPWFGKEFTEGLLMSDGYFTFNTREASSSSSRFQFPRNTSADSFRAFGLFWADLDAKTTGRAYQHFVRDPVDPRKDHLILEWKNWQFATTSNNGPFPHLNFQLVLFRDGSFEYRYGTMAGSTAANSSGSITTTGFQSHWADVGYTLTHSAALPDGLENRSWRWEPPTVPATGSRIVGPGKYTLCVTDGSWKECREVVVNEIKAGSLLISELMLHPNGGMERQWFEVINVTPGDIDLEGMTIRMGSASHVIQTGGPFVLGRGEIAVFARQNDPTLGANYVYGHGMEMDPVDGDVSIEWNGVTLGKVDWNDSWTIPMGATIGLSPTELRGDTVSWTNSSVYSVATTSYDGGLNMGTPGLAGLMDTPHYLVDTVSLKPFIDIHRTGKLLGPLTADTTRAGLPLDLNVPFFDEVIEHLWVDSNGWASAVQAPPTSTGTSPSSLPRSPTATPHGPFISVFWDNLGCTQSPRSFFFLYDQREIDGETVTILQWNNYMICSHTGGSTFQLQLWSGGDIVIAFDEIHSAATTATQQRYAGNTAWIGLEPADRTLHVTPLLRRPLVFPGRSYYFQKK